MTSGDIWRHPPGDQAGYRSGTTASVGTCAWICTGRCWPDQPQMLLSKSKSFQAPSPSPQPTIFCRPRWRKQKLCCKPAKFPVDPKLQTAQHNRPGSWSCLSSGQSTAIDCNIAHVTNMKTHPHYTLCPVKLYTLDIFHFSIKTTLRQIKIKLIQFCSSTVTHGLDHLCLL